MNYSEISVKTISGQTVFMETYLGRHLLVVNVASKCGFTPQYSGLEELWKNFASRGLVVLGFPCNQFGAQEPGTEGEIQEFCSINYGVSFPLFEKIDVNGPGEHPLYTYLKANDPATREPTPIKWNFNKFLVDPKGKVMKRHLHGVEPSAIAAELAAILPI